MAAPPSLGDLYTETLQLNNENKISTKNAFELKMIEHMDTIVDTFMSGGKVKVADDGSSRLSVGPKETGQSDEHRFHEASCTIEASAKIYACRVDVVHNNTYKVLGGLSMQEFEDEAAVGEDGKPGNAKRRRIVGVNTLERNEANITQANIDADEQNDPMFRRMAQAFDAGGAKGLLLSHLPTAEDLSITFNQDVPMMKASEIAKEAFQVGPHEIPVSDLGIGDAAEFLEKIKGSRCVPEFDTYRRELVGNKEDNYELPKELQRVLDFGRIEHSLPAEEDGFNAPIDDGAPGDDFAAPEDMDTGMGDMDAGAGFDPTDPFANDSMGGALVAPIGDDVMGAQVVHSMPNTVNVDNGKEAFDDLFSKFCSAGLNQFAYFDQCWAPLSREKDNRGVLTDGSELAPSGQLVQPLGKAEKGERATKKPLFDLEGLDQAAKKIETEPSCRHQLNEKAAQWQLYKDVPPYMMDRITMPSWPTATKNNFTCLGLRHNLLLRLQKRPPPPTEGPHSFDELYSTVIIQNHEEYPWLAAASRRANTHRGDDNDNIVCGEHEMYLGEEGGTDDFDAHGLPAHLDVDPQDLFLHPDDTVIPECDDLPDDDFGMSSGLDLDFVDKPATCGSTDIGFSRNSKFVDVKLVKKHLWDLISEELVSAKSDSKELMETSFQGLVSRTLDRLPRSECENLSIQVCFICALHLCNEKGIEIVTDKDKPLLDFAITGKP